MSIDDAQLAAHWRSCCTRAEVVGALEAIFADAAAEIARRRPVCEASGRCCNFEKWGHRLYVTGLETAYTITRAGAPTPDALAAARAAGGCPYQVLKLCGVHRDKPLGCRLYFCDPTAQGWQVELYERLMTSLRDLHDRFAIEYRYGEWRDMLDRFVNPAAH